MYFLSFPILVCLLLRIHSEVPVWARSSNSPRQQIVYKQQQRQRWKHFRRTKRPPSAVTSAAVLTTKVWRQRGSRKRDHKLTIPLFTLKYGEYVGIANSGQRRSCWEITESAVTPAPLPTYRTITNDAHEAICHEVCLIWLEYHRVVDCQWNIIHTK